MVEMTYDFSEFIRDEVVDTFFADGITTISPYLFLNTNKVTNIRLPETLISIEKYALFNLLELKSFKLPDSVESIGECGVLGFTDVETIPIGKGLKTIAEHVFVGMDSLKSFVVDEKNQYFCHDEFGVLYDRNKTILYIYPSSNERSNYTIRDGVKTIKGRAFERTTNLTHLTIPGSVKLFDSIPFRFCKSLKTIEFKGNIPPSCPDDTYDNIKDVTIKVPFGYPQATKFCGKEVIGNEYICGTNCKYEINSKKLTIKGIGKIEYTERIDIHKENIEIIEISDRITEICENTFQNYTNLTTLIIPSTVTTISKNAFANCSSLVHVEFKEHHKYHHVLKLYS